MKRLLVVALLCLIVASCSSDDGTKVRAEGGASSSTTTTEASTTTEVPTTTTTTMPPVTSPPTTAKPAPTTTAIPADLAKVTIVNDYPAAVAVTINGVRYEVAQGARKGPFGLKPASDSDAITIERADDRTCGVGNGGRYFEAGGTFEVKVYAQGSSGCGSVANGPGIAGVVNPGNRPV